MFHRWAEIYLPGVGWVPVDVNAGDREWQGDRCFSFGGIANRFLITTRGEVDQPRLDRTIMLSSGGSGVRGIVEPDSPPPLGQ